MHTVRTTMHAHIITHQGTPHMALITTDSSRVPVTVRHMGPIILDMLENPITTMRTAHIIARLEDIMVIGLLIHLVLPILQAAIQVLTVN